MTDMTPTQAQIDAAQLAKWIKELKWKSIDKDNMEFEVRMTCYVRDALLEWAALTAAAEVRRCTACGDMKVDTAAAEVALAENLVTSATDEDSKVQHFPMGRPAAAEVGMKNSDVAKFVEAATIERCAQVADEYESKAAKAIAIRIRALATEGKEETVVVKVRREEPCEICGSLKWTCGH